ncbi:MAG: T9SS type A sorting domain-containing protein [Ignavibacteriae bacterium]|nr:T9SS type A sorting domain-containing protein [Ignavibacteriota bacterium]
MDSLCGNTYRQVLSGGAAYQLRSYASNPTDQIAFIEYSLPYTSKTSIKLFNSFGADVSTITEGIIEPGTYQSAVSVSDLSPGVYYCVMQSGLFHTMQTIVVTR